MSAFLCLYSVALHHLTGVPAARHRVVVEVNVPGTVAYGTVLGNVTNLVKAFAPEKVEVEVVCHGAGIDMLLGRQKALAERVRQANKIGITFAACSNTLGGRNLSKKDLAPFIVIVDSGVAEVVRKEEAGWSYLKGAF